MWRVAPTSSARRLERERWSAWTWVSSTWVIRQPEVHLRIQGSVYYHGLAVGPDDVGESPLAGATHLHHLGPGAGQGYFSRVPREAPSLHPAVQSERFVPLTLQ